MDGRIALNDVRDAAARNRLEQWVQETYEKVLLPSEVRPQIRGVVFEVRQGYKSKDSKRQNADIANAAKAYSHLYVPALLLFSTQIDGDVAHRYRLANWVLLTGTLRGSPTASAYTFCRDVVGYDLANFFTRFSPRIKAEVENVLKTLLSA